MSRFFLRQVTSTVTIATLRKAAFEKRIALGSLLLRGELAMVGEELTRILNRRQTALLMQLRTSHVGLNRHLYAIGVAESPMCPACNLHKETVFHFLMQCRAYSTQRDTLMSLIGRRSRSLRSLLTNERTLPQLFRYISATRRFEATFGDVSISYATL